MATHPAIGTSELVLTLVAIRLAALVAVCLVARAVPTHPHHAATVCGTVEAAAMQVPKGQGTVDTAIRDMLRHD